MSINIVAADPHPIALLGLQALLAAEPGLNVLACCSTVAETRDAIKQQHPDVVVLDLHFADDHGLQLVRELRNESDLPTRFVVLTSDLSDEETIEALRLGVRGVVLKSMPTHLLVQCIQKVHAGGQWLENQSVGQAFEKMLQREAGARRLATILTARETEVMCLVAKGLSNQEIAERLVIREGTVKIHIHNIYHKLGINNRVDLTLYAQKKGLV